MSPKHTSLVVDNEAIYEMVHRKTEQVTEFAYLAPDGEVSYVKEVETTNKEVYLPYKADSNLLRSHMVLFPSRAEPYGSENELVLEIKSLITKYLDVGEFMQEIAAYYVLLTWIYDNFYELPYLRVLGDYGSGKSRFLKIIGSICYKPMFTMGAVSEASIFRMIDQIKGTLVIDEADIKYSNSNNTLVQILNSGYQKGFPIHRCLDGKGNFDVMQYEVFGPKILAGRYPFEDIALESRCLVEKMRTTKRKDIPSNLSDEFDREAGAIRNKLLMWRLHNYKKRVGKDLTTVLAVEPRLRQILFPLTAVIEDPATLEKVKFFIKSYNQELIDDRGLSTESTILVHIINLIRYEPEKEVTLRQIVDIYNFSREGEIKMSPKKVGFVMRKQLGLRTKRKNTGFILDVDHFKKELPVLCEKYGIDGEQVNLVNKDKDEGILEELQRLDLA